MFSKSLTMSVVVCKRWELLFVKPGVKVNRRYYWDILLFQQMLDAIKYMTGDIFTARAMLALQALYSYGNSIRLSVRPSVRHTPVLCQNDGTQQGAVCTVG